MEWKWWGNCQFPVSWRQEESWDLTSTKLLSWKEVAASLQKSKLTVLLISPLSPLLFHLTAKCSYSWASNICRDFLLLNSGLARQMITLGLLIARITLKTRPMREKQKDYDIHLKVRKWKCSLSMLFMTCNKKKINFLVLPSPLPPLYLMILRYFKWFWCFKDIK